MRQKEAWDALEAQGDIRDSKLLFYKGLFYEKGFGIPKNLEKAKDCYEKAYKEGFTDAAYRLGLLVAKENRPNHYYFEQACKMGSRVGCAARYGNKMVDRFDHPHS